MKTKRQCVVCILNQMLRVADYLELSEEAKDAVLQKTLKKAAGIPYSRITAPQLAQQLYGVVEKISGISDPYKALRKEQNDLVLNRIEMFEDRIKQSPDPLLTAGYYSLLGNIIDYGGVRVFDAQEVFKHFGEIEITINGYPRFKERLKQAKRVLVLGDNAGEAVFDKLFIREMKLFNPLLEIFYGVRSGPAINDVIKEDALYIGIHREAAVIETGSFCAGTVLENVSEAFKEIYYSSDIIISKGQGNFETLEQEPEDIVFIFKVKCDVVARHADLELGSLVFAGREQFGS